MARLTVTVDLLNKRTSIPATLDDKSSVVSTVSKGTVIAAEKVTTILNPALGDWYYDGQFYYWGGGMEVESSTIPAQMVTGTMGWHLDSLGIPKIWQTYQEYGNNAKIAILDTGYDINNGDLKNGIKSAKVFFDSVDGTPVTINDTFGHGSHCTSLIGGRNQTIITSCAPQCELFVGKICAQGSLKNWQIMIDAINWAVECQVDIISISYGGESPDDDLKAAISAAVNDHNILVFASIGDVAPNSQNLPCYPALFDDCIAVGASNNKNQISPITIINSKTEIYAPGDDITGYLLNSQINTLTGTSQATAIVAGIAALIISHYKTTNKTYSVATIRNLITSCSDKIVGANNQNLISPSKMFSKS